jgi:hypothetical protein
MAGLRGQNVTGLTAQEQAKRWMVSASLRSFYDDNSLNQVDELAEESLGFEFHPGVSVNLPMERTLLRGSYDFALNYYASRPDSKVDQDHILDLLLSHSFSERSELLVREYFIYSDAPEVLDKGGGTSPQRRGDASGFRNNASIDFSTRLTPVVGAQVGYKAFLRDYNQTGINSYSALLDQVEHSFHADAQMYASQSLVLFAGYQFSFVEHTSDDSLGSVLFVRDLPGRPGNFAAATFTFTPDRRDSHSHYVYLGARREFSRRLNVNAKAGARLTQYAPQPKAELATDLGPIVFRFERPTTVSPYADVSANYTYRPGSTMRLSVAVDRSATDAAVGASEELTLDTLNTVASLSFDHRFSYRFSGALSLSYLHSIYNGGSFDSLTADYFTMDSRISYKLREYVFLDLGYTWNSYSSNREGLDFTRNRVYLGIRATY